MTATTICGGPNAWVRDTLRGLVGTVLEIGPGFGTNCSYFRSDIAWIGLEPDPRARPALLAASVRFDLEPRVIVGQAERIPLPTGAVDAVVGTRVLCSVCRPERVLSEIVRVLRPLGTFVFVEHVAAPRGSGLRLVQRLAAPFSRWFDNGCDPARDTERTLRAASWRHVAVDHYAEPGPFGVRIPHIAGTAVR
jgi:SAM-dependent methyltransferase